MSYVVEESTRRKWVKGSKKGRIESFYIHSPKVTASINYKVADDYHYLLEILYSRMMMN